MTEKQYEGGNYLVQGGRGFGRHTIHDAPLFLEPVRQNRTLYDPEKVLVPDSITDACGRLVTLCIDDYPVLGYREPKPVRVADMGVGSGVFLVAMLDGLKIPTTHPVIVDAIDADEGAIAVSELNVSASAAQVPRPVEVTYKNGDYLEGLSGQYDFIYFNPPYLERGHDITHAEARLAPDQALYVEESTQEYARVVPQLSSYLTETGMAIVRLPKEDSQLDQWLLEYLKQNDDSRLLLVNDKQGREGRLLVLLSSIFPLALGSYDYWENYLGGKDRRARARSDYIPFYHDADCEVTLLRPVESFRILGAQATINLVQ
ncbi:MAG: methyltransferase [Candidatus Microsaccharimonas sp.]